MAKGKKATVSVSDESLATFAAHSARADAAAQAAWATFLEMGGRSLRNSTRSIVETVGERIAGAACAGLPKAKGSEKNPEGARAAARLYVASECDAGVSIVRVDVSKGGGKVERVCERLVSGILRRVLELLGTTSGQSLGSLNATYQQAMLGEAMRAAGPADFVGASGKSKAKASGKKLPILANGDRIGLLNKGSLELLVDGLVLMVGGHAFRLEEVEVEESDAADAVAAVKAAQRKVAA